MIILEETLSIQLTANHCIHKWDRRFLEVAQLVSTWSKDPSTKVGALAVNVERRMLAQGYNGFPAKIKDEDYLMREREVKYKLTIHAEDNIIFNACNHGIDLTLSTVYIFGMYPCPDCVKHLSQVRIARIVFQLGPSQNSDEWKHKFEDSRNLMRRLGIGFTHYGITQLGIEKQPETAINLL